MADESKPGGRRSPLLPLPSVLLSADLDRILAEHAEWLLSSGGAGRAARLFNVSLPGADFAGKDLSSARFELCEMPGARFRGSTLGSTWLHGCDLDHADFSDAIAPKAQFLSSVATGATFARARLDDACFLFAKLNQADFTGASLRKADFEDAEFHGAKFHGADICGVNLTRWFVDERQLLGAVGDLKTKLPRGFTMRTADCTLLVSKGNEMVPQAQIKG